MSRVLRRLSIVLVPAVLAACTDQETPTSLDPEAGLEAQSSLEARAPSHASSQWAERNFVVALSGSEEVPTAVDTDAHGRAVFNVSPDGTEIRFRLVVNNLMDVLQAHIHVGEAGVNGPVVVWLYPSGPPAQLIEGKKSGLLSRGVITAESLVGPWSGEPLAMLIEAMREGDVYVNVHTEGYPGGEIRGQIQGRR